ncbi:MAG: hypothetical protein PHD95_05965 [Candidatus ainarchaeum sp.]|nr:hypothetical protein [Candidatus ainarchaeum sp.]
MGQRPKPDITHVFLHPSLQALREIIKQAGREFYSRRSPEQGEKTIGQIISEQGFGIRGVFPSILRLKKQASSPDSSIAPEELIRRALSTEAHRQNVQLELKRVRELGKRPDELLAFLHKHLPQLIEAERTSHRKRSGTWTAYETDPRYRVGILVFKTLRPPASHIEEALAEAQKDLSIFEGYKLAAQEAHIQLRQVHSVFLERRIKFYKDWKALLQRLTRMTLTERRELQEYAQKIETTEQEK